MMLSLAMRRLITAPVLLTKFTIGSTNSCRGSGHYDRLPGMGWQLNAHSSRWLFYLS